MHVRGVLQEHHVPGRERRQPGAERLPEREVPGHDREDHAQGLIPHVTLRRGALDRLVGQEAGGVVGDPGCSPGALFDLGLGLDDGLAHLRCHQGRKARFLRPQDAGHRPQDGGAQVYAGVTPGVPGGVRTLDGGLDARRVQLGEGGQLLAVGGVD